MSNLLGSKENELKAIECVYKMAIESLDPENFEALELAFKALLKTRRLTSAIFN